MIMIVVEEYWQLKNIGSNNSNCDYDINAIEQATWIKRDTRIKEF